MVYHSSSISPSTGANSPHESYSRRRYQQQQLLQEVRPGYHWAKLDLLWCVLHPCFVSIDALHSYRGTPVPLDALSPSSPHGFAADARTGCLARLSWKPRTILPSETSVPDLTMGLIPRSDSRERDRGMSLYVLLVVFAIDSRYSQTTA